MKENEISKPHRSKPEIDVTMDRLKRTQSAEDFAKHPTRSVLAGPQRIVDLSEAGSHFAR
jgi:hypothetical protein